jgi:hypothetical protein
VLAGGRQGAPLKSAFIILGLLAAVCCPACQQRQVIQPAPRPAAVSTQKPLPLRAAFYISEKTNHFTYRSPDHIPWIVRPNLQILRPFEIPVGQLFAKTAFQAFSGIFQTLTVIDSLPVPGAYQLLIEPSFHNMTLDLVYFTADARPPHNQLLDVGGSLEARLRLTREGQPDWQKDYRVAIPTDRILVNPWTGEQIAGMIAEAVSSLVGAMAREMTAEPDKPAVPLDRWLKSLPRD